MAMTPVERQRLHRAREEHRRVSPEGVVIDCETGQPSSALTRVTRNLALGMADREALREAGSSEKSTILLDKAKIALAETLKAHGGHWPELVAHAVRSLHRKKKVQLGMECIEVDDVIDQREARRDLWAWNEQAGELPKPQTEEHHGTTISYTTVLGNLIDVSQRGADKVKRHKRKTAKPIETDLNTE